MASDSACRICGKAATRFHYQVRSCAGCKSFYQRALTKKSHFTCYFGGSCSTLASGLKSNRCKACRYQKYAALVEEIARAEAAGTASRSSRKDSHNDENRDLSDDSSCRGSRSPDGSYSDTSRPRLESASESAHILMEKSNYDEQIIRKACQVCQQPAMGLHYGVLSCDGCKAFFKRAVSQNLRFECHTGRGNCMSSEAKTLTRACRSCRLQKCLVLGMKIQDKFATRKKRPTTDVSRDGTKGASDQVHVNAIYARQMNDPIGQEKPFARRASMDGDACGKMETVCDRFPLFDSNFNPQVPEHLLETAEQSLVPSGQVTEFSLGSNSIFWNSLPDATFVPFSNESVGNFLANQHQMVSTVQAVGAAVEAIFGDQIARWAICKNSAFAECEVLDQPEVSADEMVRAINWHNSDNVARVQKFAALLPGVKTLVPTALKATAIGWKWLVYTLIHHASFLDEKNVHITVGPQQIRYSRYWQDVISEKPYTIFIYKFCTLFREIGLSQIEQYLFLAVVMFEPGTEDLSMDTVQLKVIHRHYIDVLFEHIKQRCQTTEELTNICLRLERFFGIFKLAFGIHMHYFRIAGHKTPVDSLAAQVRVTMLQIQVKKAADLEQALHVHNLDESLDFKVTAI